MSKTAQQIIKQIINDLTDRGGLGNEWDSIDDDIQQEIRDRWVGIVNKNLPAADTEQTLEQALETNQKLCDLKQTLTQRIFELQLELKGPDQFETWRDAAVDERVRRVALQREVDHAYSNA